VANQSHKMGLEREDMTTVTRAEIASFFSSFFLVLGGRKTKAFLYPIFGFWNLFPFAGTSAFWVRGGSGILALPSLVLVFLPYFQKNRHEKEKALENSTSPTSIVIIRLL